MANGDGADGGYCRGRYSMSKAFPSRPMLWDILPLNEWLEGILVLRGHLWGILSLKELLWPILPLGHSRAERLASSHSPTAGTTRFVASAMLAGSFWLAKPLWRVRYPSQS